jgi:hypothetical protein
MVSDDQNADKAKNPEASKSFVALNSVKPVVAEAFPIFSKGIKQIFENSGVGIELSDKMLARLTMYVHKIADESQSNYNMSLRHNRNKDIKPEYEFGRNNKTRESKKSHQYQAVRRSKTGNLEDALERDLLKGMKAEKIKSLQAQGQKEPEIYDHTLESMKKRVNGFMNYLKKYAKDNSTTILSQKFDHNIVNLFGADTGKEI